jgi:hypothetical protein
MTSETVSIEIPREVLHVARMTRQELVQELAVHLFQQCFSAYQPGPHWRV